MAVYPVIMCGGSGARLWPVSREDRPKQFLSLVGERSSFQETALRVTGLPGAARTVIVAGVRHREAIQAQLAEIGAEAVLLLEPEGRESAAAIAAAAAWIAARDPEGIAAIVSADHHIPDAAGFASAIAGTLAAARAGDIVTLGVKPTEPSTAYGYIRPAVAETQVKAAEAFVEKPDLEVARRYLAEGYLWNSGNFVALASTLLAELDTHAPAVAKAARAAVAEGRDDAGAVSLGPAFLGAPKTSIDYAVMEKTRRAAVLPVDFAWWDIGAWDAVWAASPKDSHGNSLKGDVQAPGSQDLLVRAAEGVHVAVVGASRLAVVVEPGAVLVAGLDSAQSVKGAAAEAPVRGRAFASLDQARAWYSTWFRTAALPVWATLGVDAVTGTFHEGITLDGRIHAPYARARVQARQVFVYSRAARAGFDGPWLQAAARGMDAYIGRFQRPDGLFGLRCNPEGDLTDSTPCLYEQAFSLLAMSALSCAGVSPRNQETLAERILSEIWRRRTPSGGYLELDDHPFQSNAHMHLLEAALAWEQAGGGPVWQALSDEIVALALAHFIDGEGGFLREFFDQAWAPAAGDDGRWVEPGHQFEWAWLLARWGSARGEAHAGTVARRLYENGLKGVDRRRGVAVNVLWDDLGTRDASARLWPQTEYLKAALILGDEAEALNAAKALALYLDVPVRGTWRDKMRPDGGFIDEPAPASSLYHLAMAVFELLGIA